jgi:hypothetical protein
MKEVKFIIKCKAKNLLEELKKVAEQNQLLRHNKKL